jgi:hypothetical protein
VVSALIRPAGQPLIDCLLCFVGTTPPVNGHLVTLPAFIGHKEVRDLLDELLRKIVKILNAVPVRVLTRYANHFGLAFTLVAQP